VKAEFLVPALECETDGALRAQRGLRDLRSYETQEGERPTIRSLETAVRQVLDGGADRADYFFACRLGASIEALANAEGFKRIFREMVDADTVEGAPAFWHHELLLFLACQLRAAGVDVGPMQPDGRQDPDLYDGGCFYIEVKRRRPLAPNSPKSLTSFVVEALKAGQIRKREQHAVGMVAMDFGAYDGEIHAADFCKIDEKICTRLRNSKLLHGVLVSAVKRGDPSTWLFLADDGIEKHRTMPKSLREQLVRAFPFGTIVLPGGAMEDFGVTVA
jgi:hypothetical protein